VADISYRYELRRRDEIVATGHETLETAREVVEHVTIGGFEGIVREVAPILGNSELRLVVQLLPDNK
jgi:hypothetical protein